LESTGEKQLNFVHAAMVEVAKFRANNKTVTQVDAIIESSFLIVQFIHERISE
jgi:hypothetical protein